MPNMFGQIDLGGQMLGSEVASAILAGVADGDPVRIMLVGPAGVGKSDAARAIHDACPAIEHIEHDSLKPEGPGLSPCSVSGFNLTECFGPHVRRAPQFVLDVGAGCVFRAGVDNETRFREVQEFKAQHSLQVVLLTARREIVLERYLTFPGSFEKYFESAWLGWNQIEGPYWARCADFTIDSSADAN